MQRYRNVVMPGLVPGIHVFLSWSKDVDGRDKPGHDAFS
jgi:2-oxoglutarate/2-oxoacid ferredoxin oxidoreductase subunit beta